MNKMNENTVIYRRILRILASLTLSAAMIFGSGRAILASDQPSGYTNILLIGTDRRDESWNGNSDAMILATIKKDSGKIILTSFMRDLYADIPEYGVHKLNYAFAVGGAEKLVETVENNYELAIDHYAVVDFKSMAEVVDLIGGVELTITDAECKWLNGYLDSMGVKEDYLPGGGTYRLTGNQAVAYARIRHDSNNDYGRTQRQRDILKEIFSQMRTLDAEKIGALAKDVLPEIKHNYSALEVLSLLAELPDIAGCELEEQRIPYDNLFHSQNEMLVPDFEATKARLHEALNQ